MTAEKERTKNEEIVEALIAATGVVLLSKGMSEIDVESIEGRFRQHFTTIVNEGVTEILTSPSTNTLTRESLGTEWALQRLRQLAETGTECQQIDACEAIIRGTRCLAYGFN